MPAASSSAAFHSAGGAFQRTVAARWCPATRSASAPSDDATIGTPAASATDSVYEYVSGTCAGKKITSGFSAARSCGSRASSYWPKIDSGASGDCGTGSVVEPRMRNVSGSARSFASCAQAATTRSPFSGDRLPRTTTRATGGGSGRAGSGCGQTVTIRAGKYRLIRFATSADGAITRSAPPRNDSNAARQAVMSRSHRCGRCAMHAAQPAAAGSPQ